MQLRISIKTCTTIILLLLAYAAYPQIDTAALSAKIDRSKDKSIKNAVVLLYKDGRIVYKKETSLLNIKTQEPIGEASQWLTAALIMTFVDQGKLSLDDKVSDYLPLFAKHYKAYITIRHCLTHYTGIQSAQGVARLLQKNKYHTLEEEVNDFASKREIQTNAGTEFRYSDMGFKIAGRVLEVISKKAFDRLMKERLLIPLSMRNTTFTNEDYNDAIDPFAGGRSTAADYMNFLVMLLHKGTFNNKQVLSESSVDMLHSMQAPANIIKNAPKIAEGLNYALGEWILENDVNEKPVAVSVPSLQGTWPVIDLCRKYAFVLFTKEIGEQKRDLYIDIKRIIDNGLAATCNTK